MRLEVKISTVGDTHQLVPLPLFFVALRKKAILNIDGALRIMRKLFLRLFVEPQVIARNTYVGKPFMASIDPLLMRRLIVTWFDEVFHLHLFKLARAKDEVTGCDLVAK